MKEKWNIVWNGIFKENPSLRLVLGTCPTLAVTTQALNGLGTIREVLGSGSIFGLALHLPVEPMILFITPAGGFFVFGMLMAAVVFIEEKTGRRRERKAGCAGCPSAEVCGGEGCDG